MSAAKIRADYDQLKAVAGRFGSQAQAARQTLQSLQQRLDQLQAGDWAGQGASAFYQEMGGQVLPTMSRLVSALESAQQSILSIGQFMAQAEADAARVLRGSGSGLPGTAVGASPGAAAAFAAARPAPTRAHGKSSAAKPPPNKLWGQLAAVDPKLADQLLKNKSLMQKLKLLDEQGIALMLANIAGGAQSTYEGDMHLLTVDRKHVLEALSDFADDQLYGSIQMLPGLGPQLAAEVKREPVLMEQLRDWDQDAVEVKLGAQPGVSIVKERSVILDPKKPMQSLRDGLRQWQRSEYPELPPEKAAGRDQYVSFNVDSKMEADARELLRVDAARLRVEGQVPKTLLQGQPTDRAGDYDQAVRNFAANGSLATPDPVKQVVQLLYDEPPSNTNRWQYEDELGQKWDQWEAAHQK